MGKIKISDIKIGKRHRRDMGDIESLAESIRLVGLIHPPVVNPENLLVSGQRRLEAAKLLGWSEIPVHIWNGENLIFAERDENCVRKDLGLDEKIKLTDDLLAYEQSQARARQLSGLKEGDKEPRSGKLPEREKGQTRDKVARAVGLSGRTYEKAREIIESAKKEPKKYKTLLKEMIRTGRVNGVAKKLKVMKAAEQIAKEPPPLPTGPFRVIVADPPWSYSNRPADASHRVSNPYPSMTIEQIKAMPVGNMAEKDSILWLWTTNSHIEQSFEIVRAWGFEYKTLLTWVKNRMGVGDWLRGKTEHCLLAIKGKPTIVLSNQTTELRGKAREHSKKPEEFYSMVEKLCPGSKVELFGRTKRPGWEVFGNEV